MNDGIHYDYHDAMTRNAPLTIVLGGRGIGKTYAYKMLSMTRPYSTLHLSRQDKESARVANGYLKDLPQSMQMQFNLQRKTILDDGEVQLKNPTVYKTLVDKDGVEKIQFTSLNVQNKGIPFEGTNQVIFDEFLIAEGSSVRYMKNEVTLFYDLLQTIMRNKKKFRVIMIANLIDWNNPYFAHWGIEKIDFSRRFTWIKKPDILLECPPNNPEWMKEYNESAFKRIVDGTQYDQYMQGGMPLINYDIQVKRRPPMAIYRFNLYSREFNLAVWESMGIYYVTDYGIDESKQGFTNVLSHSVKNRYYDPKIKTTLKKMIGTNVIYGESITARNKLLTWLR